MALNFMRSLKVTLLLAVFFCGVYPGAVWMAGQVLFKHKADGSLIQRRDMVVGSELIGQVFTKPEYFHGRPSAAGEKGYDAASSSGSNLGPTNKKLIERVSGDIDRALSENPGLRKGQIPVDLVTASGSGLDPHISPEAAEVQVERVAQARQIAPEKVRDLMRAHTEAPQWGLFGEARVNVLELNLALDGLR